MVSTDALDPRILNTDSYQMDPNNIVIVEECLPDTTQSTKMAESSKSRTLETVPEETKF